MINKKEKLAIASPWSARILEASVRRGYQNNSNSQNINAIPDSVNAEDILHQSTPEERVADKATASIPRVNTFASFSETDVTDMIDAGVFVPEALLDKFATNSVSSRRRQTDP